MITEKIVRLSNVQREAIRRASGVFGCYVLYDSARCLYVGKSFDCGQRLMTHFCGSYKSFDGNVIVCDLSKIASEMNHVEARQYLSYYERAMIRQLKPLDNRKAKNSPMTWREFEGMMPKVQMAIINRVESIID